MRKISTCLFLMLAIAPGLFLQAQQLSVNPVVPVFTPPGAPNSGGGPEVLCNPDTVAYPQYKASGLVLLNVNNVNSAQGLTQYYNCPQEMTVYGFSFFAYAPGAATPVNVSCELYLASPDSLPMGSPIASVTVPVDSNAGLFTLAELERHGVFANPVTISQPYILCLANRSATSVSLCNSSYTAGDGDGEWLAGADFRHNPGGQWTRGYDVNVGGTPFDADILLHPMVQYDLVADFIADSTCLTNTDTVCFTNISSPVFLDRMYSYYAFIGLNNSVFAWDYGDFTGLQYWVDTCHYYSTNGPFTVYLYGNMYNWTGACGANVNKVIGDPGLPIAGFNPLVNGAYVTFQNTSSGAATVDWNFGDGGTASSFSPQHFYTANGTYPVTLIITNGCGADTLVDSVTINCVAPVAGFTWTNSFLSVNFTNTSTNGTSYQWQFGDGGQSALLNPGHVYPAYGGYLVTLIVTSNCGNDTIQDSVILSAPVSILNGTQEKSIRMWPNPAGNQLSIEIPFTGSEGQLQLTDMQGRVFLRRNFSGMRNEEMLSLDEVPQGIYLVTLRSGSDFWTGRLSVMK